WVVIKFVVVWLIYPETKGPSLEEIATIFNSPGGSGVLNEKTDVELAKIVVGGIAKDGTQTEYVK
ncbi:hypothetical protein B0J14DRAFT_489584, partial [Halenospora varia]